MTSLITWSGVALHAWPFGDLTKMKEISCPRKPTGFLFIIWGQGEPSGLWFSETREFLARYYIITSEHPVGQTKPIVWNPNPTAHKWQNQTEKLTAFQFVGKALKKACNWGMGQYHARWLSQFHIKGKENQEITLSLSLSLHAFKKASEARYIWLSSSLKFYPNKAEVSCMRFFVHYFTRLRAKSSIACTSSCLSNIWLRCKDREKKKKNTDLGS